MKDKNIVIQKEDLAKCCGSMNWIEKMINKSAINSKEKFLEAADKVWYSLRKEDWLEAFTHHPKIGDLNSLKEKFSSTKLLAENEQSGVNSATNECLTELARLNEEYERKFGYIFIVCATGKTADEMLALIRERIKNNSEEEVMIAMEEQNKITKLRLEKLL